MRFMKKCFRWVLIVQAIAGGFVGLFATSPNFLTFFQASGLLPFLMGGAFSILFLFVIVSGLLYLFNPQCVIPLCLALFLQVPWIALPRVAYGFTAGFSIIAGIGHGPPPFYFGSAFRFYIGWPGPTFIGINLFALGMLVLLLISIPMPGSAKQPREPATHT